MAVGSLPIRLRHRFARVVRNLRYRYFDNFIFIHINKTGGSSIEKALNLPFEHITALERIRDLGREKWDSKYSFTVVRNPWDKVVSQYHFRLQTNQSELGARPIDFGTWVRLTYGDKDPAYYDDPKMFMPQSDWITNRHGQVLVDYVCRFENLNNDFRHVCGVLGKTAELPHFKSSKRGNYRDYFDEETIGIVSRWFEKDIENFQYHF